MANSVDEMKKVLEQIQQLYRQIYSKPLSIDSTQFKDASSSLEKAAEFANTLMETFTKLKSPVNAIRQNLHILNYDLKGIKKPLDLYGASITSITKLSLKLRDIRLSDYNTSKKQLLNLKDSLTTTHKNVIEASNLLKTSEEDLQSKLLGFREKRFSLTNERNIRKVNQEILAAQEAQSNIQNYLNEEIKEMYDNISATEKEIEVMNKKLGMGPQLVEGISKGLGKIGFGRFADNLGLQDAVNKTLEFNIAQGKSASVLGTASNFAKNLGTNLGKSLGPAALIVAAFETLKKIFSLMFQANKDITNIANNFGVTKDEANSIRQRMFQISDSATVLANTSKGVLLTYDSISKALDDINSSFGIAVDFTNTLNSSGKELLAQYANARDNLGLSTEALKEGVGYSQIQNKSLDNVLKSIVGQNIALSKQGLSLKSTRQILNEVFKVTGGIRANFKGSLDQITKGVTAASLMGTTLEQVARTQESLLDFESSIQNELEAELLTGKNLNLERARGYALQGDMNGLMKELNKNAISFGEFTKMNVIQQESFAKAIGLGREDLADMLFQKQALGSIQKQFNKQQIQALKDEESRLRSLGKSTTQINEGVQQYALQLASQQDAQSKFNNALLKAQEIFTRLVEGRVFDKLADALTDVVDFFSSRTSKGESIIGQAQGNSELSKRLNEAYSKDVFLGNMQKYSNAHPNDKEVLSSIEDRKKKVASEIRVEDFVIKTSPKDTVVAAGGTKLGGNNEIVQKLNELIDAVNKGGSIYLDGIKVTTEMERAHQRFSRGTQ